MKRQTSPNLPHGHQAKIRKRQISRSGTASEQIIQELARPDGIHPRITARIHAVRTKAAGQVPEISRKYAVFGEK